MLAIARISLQSRNDKIVVTVFCVIQKIKGRLLGQPFYSKYYVSRIYSSTLGASSAFLPYFRETRIPTKSESAINPNEAHSGT